MPELPEVETTRCGIEPHVLEKKIRSVELRERQLRWPVPANLGDLVSDRKVQSVGRRGKYLLIDTGNGTVMIHLGMSGSLRIVPGKTPAEKHDHVDFRLQDGNALRYRDPRKFGSIHWIEGDPMDHPLLVNLGPEPLTGEFDGDYLFRQSRKRKAAVKTFIMDSHVVVGVGNIYANEALFRSGIRPARAAGRVTREKFELLAFNIKQILAEAIKLGGTTLRDFIGGDGEPGYFKQSLNVYGRGGLPCRKCKSILKEIRLGQRSSVYCSQCQK
jgi:formamidopyrimidine-DNA glycosylase